MVWELDGGEMKWLHPDPSVTLSGTFENTPTCLVLRALGEPFLRFHVGRKS